MSGGTLRHQSEHAIPTGPRSRASCLLDSRGTGATTTSDAHRKHVLFPVRTRPNHQKTIGKPYSCCIAAPSAERNAPKRSLGNREFIKSHGFFDIQASSHGKSFGFPQVVLAHLCMERNNGVDGGGRRRATHASRGTSSPRGVELTHPKGERINWPRWKTLSNIPPKENNVNYSQKKTVRRIPEFPGIRQVEPRDFLNSQEFGNSAS